MRLEGKVTLEYHELLLAGIAGVMRQVENLKLKREAAHGIERGTKGDWQANIEGVIGELAVSKHLDVYWKGKGEFRGADVGRDFQVRTTSYATGHLWLFREDPEDKVFILVTGSGLEYHIRGWINGAQGKRQKYWGSKQEGREAFWVPQHDLMTEWIV